MRKTTAERGYGSEHEKLRALWKPLVDAGQVACREVICIHRGGRAIRPGDPWHLAHDVDGSYRGPAHAECNTSEAGKRGNRSAKRKMKPRRRRRPETWSPTQPW